MSEAMDWLGQNSGGSGYPGVGFPAVGATVKGRIEGTPRPVETEYGARLVVDLVAVGGCSAVKGDSGEPIAEGDTVTLWIKPGSMASAVKQAIADANASGLSEGGTLAVQYERDGERKKASFNPPKFYRASYSAPVAAVGIGDDLL